MYRSSPLILVESVQILYFINAELVELATVKLVCCMLLVLAIVGVGAVIMLKMTMKSSSSFSSTASSSASSSLVERFVERLVDSSSPCCAAGAGITCLLQPCGQQEIMNRSSPAPEGDHVYAVFFRDFFTTGIARIKSW